MDRLNVSRSSWRRTSDSILREQLVEIAKRGISGTRGRGWDYEIGPINESRPNSDSPIQFTSWIRFFRKSPIDPGKEFQQRAEIYEWAKAAGHHSRYKDSPWIVKDTTSIIDNIKPTNDPLDDTGTFAPLSEIKSTISCGPFFSHLYGLESQINVLLSSIQAAADSKMVNRFHSLLYGSPGCGKTEILESTSRLLRSMNINHQVIDATSMTEAGIRKDLLAEDKVVPDVLLLEEVEKVPDTSLRPLLGIMDIRATVSVLNYRRVASRKIPALVLATANDMNQLSKMMYGALRSRFQHEIYCPRPNREVLGLILKREIEKVSGELEWIEPTLKFCFDEHHITDPRKLIPVCLCGKGRLLTGEYQKDLLRSMDPKGQI
jgi:ATPase family protein associated with various cellular activities (AAA)